MKKKVSIFIALVTLIGLMTFPTASAATETAEPAMPLSNWTSQRHSGRARQYSQRHISWRATTRASTTGANGQAFSVALIRGSTPDVPSVNSFNVRRNGTSQLPFNDAGAGTYHFRYTRNAPSDGIAINSTGNVLLRSSSVTWGWDGDIIW